MTVPGPLDHIELRAVDACLERGDLAEAQQRLAQLGAAPFPAAGLSYLATRLLFLRKRLDSGSVAQRMQELLLQHPNFVEARALLSVASVTETSVAAVKSQPLPAVDDAPTPIASREPSAPFSERPGATGSEPPRVAPSVLPTYRPPNWPPPNLIVSEDEHDRPTAVPVETPPRGSGSPTSNEPPRENRQLVVDTRGSGNSSGSDAPFSWSGQRPRRDGRYALGPSSSLPPPAERPVSIPPLQGTPLHSIPPGPTTLDPVAPQTPPRISVAPPSPPRTHQSQESGNVYARPDPRLPMAQAPEDRLQFISGPPVTAQRPSTIPPAQRPLDEILAAGELWPPLEQEVARGDHAQAIAYFEDAARRQLSHLPSAAPEREPELLAQLCAELLNKSWVTHHFAPFDLSLQSLSRLQLAVATLYGTLPRERPASALFLLLGSYVGEVLRLTHRGTWRQLGASPLLSTVRAGASEWQPYDLVRTWLHSGGRRSLALELATSIARPGSLAWQAKSSVKVTPHVLWQGEVQLESVPGLARALSSSVWSAACSLLAQQPLDLSFESLSALDWLLQQLTDSAQPLRGDELWLQRIALLLGIYAGEVYRTHAPAEWLDTEEPGLERFLLQLGTGLSVSPVGMVITSSVTRRTGAVAAWTNALMADPRRKPA